MFDECKIKIIKENKPKKKQKAEKEIAKKEQLRSQSLLNMKAFEMGGDDQDFTATDDNQVINSNKKIRLDELDLCWERIFNKNPDVKKISMDTF